MKHIMFGTFCFTVTDICVNITLNYILTKIMASLEI